MTVAARARNIENAAALAFRRCAFDPAVPAASLLGGLVYGGTAGDVGFPGPGTRLLAPAAPMLDAWSSGGRVVRGERGCLRYATNGDWLHGWADLDEQAAGGLQAAAERCYREIFELLDAGPTPHLLRLWNYLADINRDGESLERYRHFNVGRQQAFLAAGRSAFESAPAACALGTTSGPLRVVFLAGRNAPVALENPRQVSAYRYPSDYGPRSPSFSRAALADLGAGRPMLFVSGTASIVGHASVHGGDVCRQAEESLANIGAIRAVAEARTGRRFDAGTLVYTLYLRRAADLDAVRGVFEAQVGATSAAARGAIYLLADVCRAELLVEIEAHGWAGVDAA